MYDRRNAQRICRICSGSSPKFLPALNRVHLTPRIDKGRMRHSAWPAGGRVRQIGAMARQFWRAITEFGRPAFESFLV